MASTSSISGLASGLDTATIIDQLMQLEAVPQTRLKTQQTTEKTVLTALQSLNTDAALARPARPRRSPRPATWQTLRPPSPAPASPVTVGTGTAPASPFSVTVDRLAAHPPARLRRRRRADRRGRRRTVKLTGNDGTVHDIATGGGTLTELVAAINAATARHRRHARPRSRSPTAATGCSSESTTTGAASTSP